VSPSFCSKSERSSPTSWSSSSRRSSSLSACCSSSSAFSSCSSIPPCVSGRSVRQVVGVRAALGLGALLELLAHVARLGRPCLVLAGVLGMGGALGLLALGLLPAQLVDPQLLRR